MELLPVVVLVVPLAGASVAAYLMVVLTMMRLPLGTRATRWRCSPCHLLHHLVDSAWAVVRRKSRVGCHYLIESKRNNAIGMTIALAASLRYIVCSDPVTYLSCVCRNNVRYVQLTSLHPFMWSNEAEPVTMGWVLATFCIVKNSFKRKKEIYNTRSGKLISSLAKFQLRKYIMSCFEMCSINDVQRNNAHQFKIDR
mmetsp:Transcript_4125/g.5532  ORF Transcript_4125/g.5532 Transcript_4125/m.5532 type:complete len:197 (+) Transcript_4125:928-1518(+)